MTDSKVDYSLREFTNGLADIRVDMTKNSEKITKALADIRVDMAKNNKNTNKALADIRVDFINKMSSNTYWIIGTMITIATATIGIILRFSGH
ncbi:hypothetical protein [Candidatus Liberibacter brunswickensis]|uniref:hypothetical protein n=1 Tax=Candidatus Liberibacter brunswickensis TaxID=1968796 RepID=UPI002FDFB21A